MPIQTPEWSQLLWEVPKLTTHCFSQGTFSQESSDCVMCVHQAAETTTKRLLKTTCLVLLSLEPHVLLIHCHFGRICCSESVMQSLYLILINYLNDSMDAYPAVTAV